MLWQLFYARRYKEYNIFQRNCLLAVDVEQWCEFIIIEALDSIRLEACYTVVPNYKHDMFQYGCNKLQSVHNSLHIHIIFPLPAH